ncbi:MAG: hypothetical protein R3C69_11860 [Geminicoccaceae bacterium]
MTPSSGPPIASRSATVGWKPEAFGGDQLHDLDVEGLEDVAIGGIAGLGHGDARPGIEGGEEGQDEAARRPGGDGDALDGHGPAVGGLDVAGDGGAAAEPEEGLR